MSNDIRIRTSAWRIPLDQHDAACRALVDARYESPSGAAEPLFDLIEQRLDNLMEGFCRFGLDDIQVEDQVIVISGTLDAEWIDGTATRQLISVLAPYSLRGSYLEIESEYDSEPSRWILLGEKVIEISPTMVWQVPGDPGGWNLDAHAVRAELEAAAHLHDLDEEQAGAIIALPDHLIHQAIQGSIGDVQWGVFDDLRRDVIVKLADRLSSEQETPA